MTVTDNLRLGAFPRYTGARPKGDVAADLERAMALFPRLKERRLQLAGGAIARRPGGEGGLSGGWALRVRGCCSELPAVVRAPGHADGQQRVFDKPARIAASDG